MHSSKNIVKYLNGDLSPKFCKDLGFDGINYAYKIYKENPTWISESKKLGLTTGCWTINKENKFKDLVEMGIEFITTDYPDKFSKRK